MPPRRNILCVRLSDEEAALLEEMSRLTNTEKSTYVRVLLERAANSIIRERHETVDLKRAIRLLKKIQKGRDS